MDDAAASAAVAGPIDMSVSLSATRVVIFIRVVGCGTSPSMSMRQNRRHEMESATSANNVS